jgi:hypothetical protein
MYVLSRRWPHLGKESLMAVTMRGCERGGHTDCYYDGNAEGAWTHSRACGWWWKRYQTAEAKGYPRALEEALKCFDPLIRDDDADRFYEVAYRRIKALKEKVKP